MFQWLRTLQFHNFGFVRPEGPQKPWYRAEVLRKDCPPTHPDDKVSDDKDKEVEKEADESLNDDKTISLDKIQENDKNLDNSVSLISESPDSNVLTIKE